MSTLDEFKALIPAFDEKVWNEAFIEVNIQSYQPQKIPQDQNISFVDRDAISRPFDFDKEAFFLLLGIRRPEILKELSQTTCLQSFHRPCLVYHKYILPFKYFEDVMEVVEQMKRIATRTKLVEQQEDKEFIGPGRIITTSFCFNTIKNFDVEASNEDIIKSIADHAFKFVALSPPFDEKEVLQNNMQNVKEKLHTDIFSKRQLLEKIQKGEFQTKLQTEIDQLLDVAKRIGNNEIEDSTNELSRLNKDIDEMNAELTYYLEQCREKTGKIKILRERQDELNKRIEKINV